MQRHTKPQDVVSRIVDNAARHPDLTALSQVDARVSYAEVDRWSSAVAADLRAVGVRPGDPVAVLAPRGAAAVVGQLAATRIGAWYVAVDPGQPTARQAMLLERCACVAVLCTDHTTGLAPGNLPAVPLTRRSREPLPVVEGASLPAYACFTSGSTGPPKGILVSRGALSAFVAAATAEWRLGPGEVVAGCCPFDWDGSVIDTWVTLAAGACALGGSDDQYADPAATVRLIVNGNADAVFLPTALGQLVLDSPRLAQARRLRVLVLGGDRLTKRPPAGAGFRMWNIYGPTETTVAATWEIVDPAGEGEIPIGRPVPGAVVEVVDDALQPVAAGLQGEILIGGSGVAHGYLGDPRQTAARYVPAPGGRRRYRTGDYGSWRPDGRLVFVGRRDRQVSVHGRRMELDGVRTALLRHAAVTDAAVELFGDGQHAEAVAFVAACSPVDPDELRAGLGNWLTAKQLPDRIIVVDALPTGDGGGGAALARLRAQDRGRTAGERPADDIDRSVLSAWVAQLERPDAGMTDNFFATGGNSLLAARLVQQVQSDFGIELRLLDFFASPNPRSLSRLVRKELDRSAEVP